MAARKQLFHPDYPFYVYAIMRGPVCVYVGKGSGYRACVSAKRHGGEYTILKKFRDEVDAYDFEVEMISELMPENNRCPGGNGSRKRPFLVPKVIRGEISEEAFAKLVSKKDDVQRGMEKLGPRKYVAKMLVDRYWYLLEPSKLDALRGVANGPWA